VKFQGNRVCNKQGHVTANSRHSVNDFSKRNKSQKYLQVLPDAVGGGTLGLVLMDSSRWVAPEE